MLRLENIRKTFVLPSSRSVSALEKVNLTVEAGEFVVVVGANGAGKSTLFNVISGRTRADQGKVFIGGIDVTSIASHKRADRVTMVNQARNTGLPRAMTVREVIRLALESRRPCRRREVDELVSDRLERLEPGLSRVLQTQLWHLSGGEHQLVALAFASVLCEDTRRGHVLLLDEHVSQLAPGARSRVIEATNELVRREGLTTMLATHSPSVAASIGDRQIVVHGGCIHSDMSGPQRVSDTEEMRRVLVAICDGHC